MPLSSVVGAQSIVKPGVCTSSTRPASPYDGQVIYETDTDRTLVYNGTGWVFLSTSRANPGGFDLVQAETSFTSATTFSANNIFTSNYRNYRIIINATNGDGSMTMRLRSSSTDTTTNYNAYGVYGTSSVLFTNNPLGTDEWYLCDMTSSVDGSGNGVIDIYSPQAATATSITGSFYGASGASQYFYTVTGQQNSSTQFDGFTILITSTGMTGTYTVYGYAK